MSESIGEPTPYIKIFNVDGKKVLKQIIKTSIDTLEWREVEMELDIETPDPSADTTAVAILPNGQTASNVYEAYDIGLKQATRKTTIYLTEGDIRYIYEKLEYKGILNKIDFELARTIEKEVLRRNT